MTTTEPIQNTDTVDYRYVEADDIHTFRFKESSRQAVDDWIRIMDVLYIGRTEDQPVRVLIDIQQTGMLPVRYLFTRGQQWANNLSVHPQARIAYVHKGETIISIVGTMTQLLRFGHLRVQFFKDDEPGAIHWLKHS